MENKAAYAKIYDMWGYNYYLLNLTGKCKTVTGYHGENKYYQYRVKLFGIPLWTRWVHADCVVWGPAPSVKYFDCECKDGK